MAIRWIGDFCGHDEYRGRVSLLVERHRGSKHGVTRVDFWDSRNQIPADAYGVDVDLGRGWERMHLNIHPTWAVVPGGCWVKQRESRDFDHQAGLHEFEVRFFLPVRR